MNYSQAIDFLYSLQRFGTKLGLENTFQLAGLFNEPQQRLRFIHVAGTNGKGSTCAFLESIYRHAGCRVGLFTSPHLVSFTERIQVERRCISEEEVSRLTALIMERLGGDQLDRWTLRPTFFEFVTMMALLYFERQGCELVIWETGMGGRLDATNIVTPLASLITNIQADHQQWLGNTLAEIAAEKAGIIKPGVPVLTATENTEALAVIRARAAELNAPFKVVTGSETSPLSLLGAHQKRNAALARATVDILNTTIAVDEPTLRKAFLNTHWPGRLQLVTTSRGRVLLDGAHNPAGAVALAKTLREQFGDERITLVLGLFRDKSWDQICEILVPLSDRVLLVPVQSERSVDPLVVQQFCQRWEDVSVDVSRDLRSALMQAPSPELKVVSGSLYLVGEAMEILNLAPDSKTERELNEWDASGNKPG